MLSLDLKPVSNAQPNAQTHYSIKPREESLVRQLSQANLERQDLTAR
jgi:hypothetical protein